MEKKKQKADKKEKRKEADDGPTFGKTIEILRTVRGLSQRKLAAISEISQSALSDYESDKKTPQYLRIERLLASMGFYFSAIDQTRAYLSLLYRTHVFARAEDRAEAPGLFLRLKPYPLKAQQAIIREAKEFHVWSLAEFLALESVRIAAEDAEKALELAQLAVTTAEAIGGCTPWLSKLRAFAYAHLGNAYRIFGDLRKADEAFAKFSELWQAGKDDPTTLLDEARLIAMKAALRREQRRFDEALRLLDQALALDKHAALRGVLLLSKSKALEEAGDAAEALTVLRSAGAFIDPVAEPRLFLCYRQNLLLLLVELQAFTEAAPLLAEVTELSRRLSNRLDRVRLRWAEARIADGHRETDLAISLFNQVRADFISADMTFDAALVSLDLATLFAREGRPSEVKAMARSLVPIFEAQGVDREALASLAAFRQAAEREAASVSLIRATKECLARARPNPRMTNEKMLWAEVTFAG
jgi:tetratricopeptide (TPR) repeat protein